MCIQEPHQEPTHLKRQSDVDVKFALCDSQSCFNSCSKELPSVCLCVIPHLGKNRLFFLFTVTFVERTVLPALEARTQHENEHNTK